MIEEIKTFEERGETLFLRVKGFVSRTTKHLYVEEVGLDYDVISNFNYNNYKETLLILVPSKSEVQNG